MTEEPMTKYDAPDGSELEICAADQPVRIGGLMRCCTLTLRQTPWHGTLGDRIDCRHCATYMEFSRGAWAFGGRR